MTTTPLTNDGTAGLTRAEQALLPTDAAVAWYAEHGWWLSGKLFSDDEIDALVEASEAFYAGAVDRELPVRPPHLAWWTPEQGPVQRHNDYVHALSDPLGALLRKPLVGAVAARLAGAQEIRIWQSTLIYKPPVPGEPTNRVPWHMDRHYWQTCTSENMLTGFLPFHDCDERMGTITMVDGSHRWEEIPGDDSTRHFAARNASELDALLAANAAHNGTEVVTVPIVIPKGHISFHHCKTYHGSGQNMADVPRRAVSLHLQPGDNRYREFRKPGGEKVVYNHDVVARKNAAGDPDYTDPFLCPSLWRSE